MRLETMDWVIISIFFMVSLVVGIIVSKRAGSSFSEFFLSGRTMPWWLLGISMVATTFSSSAPNLVTGIVRRYGVAGNWLWWAFLLTGMLTVFVYAKLWRRSGITTDIEFYELRYSGKAAAFLRGFRAIYLGLLFNVMIMADVSLAAIKIGGIMFGFSPLKTILIASIVTVIYCMAGGLRGVIITDFIQFGIAMFGSVAAALIAVRLPEVGGLKGLLSNELLCGKLSMFPDFSNTSIDIILIIFIIPLTVQWWSVWYPGAEPGGGGYIVQRMLAAKDERHATGATLLFNIFHYALRPWPWILVGLASIIVYPTLESLYVAFPNIPMSKLSHDLAYPAMLTYLPSGLMGLVIASLIAAFMSTISTHLNWGSSYIVNDFYKRFITPDAPEKKLVLMGRISTLVLMIIGAIVALLLKNSLQSFNIILQIGAGTGLLFILRWFWWRINAASEISAMIISFFIAVYFNIIHASLGFQRIPYWQELVLGILITTIGWILITLLTKPTKESTLREFYRTVQPGRVGWSKIVKKAEQENNPIEMKTEGTNLPAGILCMVFGCIAGYGLLLATGYWIYTNYIPAIILTISAVLAVLLLLKLWRKLNLK